MLVQLMIILLGLVRVSKCSLVVDSFSQDGLYVTDYCPKMPHCPEGAHVMCMYYNPNSVMGPKCYNAQNVSITSEIATKMLDISNAIRSKIALGKEKGENGEHLPRGYGIFKLMWDNELATFAQVLANQCVLRHDLCRATKKFPDPGQTGGLVRFTIPDWFPISRSKHFTSPGISEDKMVYAAIQTLKRWYIQKEFVTSSMIVDYPDWTLHPKDQLGRLYMEMIHGSTTHMGCGVSAYSAYSYKDNYAALNYNAMQVMCNFSTRPRKGGVVYNTTQPISAGYTVRCGCPPGSDEDDDCLCSENPDASAEKIPAKVCSENDVDCKDPTVVVLPIFTMEDAPQSKLIGPPQIDNTTLRINDDSMEIFKIYENSFENHLQTNLIQPNKKNNLNTRIVRNHILPVNKKQILPRKLIFPRVPKKNDKFIQKRIFSKNMLLEDLHKSSKSITSPTFKNRRPSIFNKVQQFHLPILNRNLHSTPTNIKHSTIDNNLLSVHKKLVKGINPIESNHISVPELPDIKVTDRPSIKDSTLNTAEDSIMNHEHIWRENLLNAFIKPANIEEESKETENLLHLLDKLEKQIKSIDLKENEKKLIDAKIRKIYGSVVGHQNVLSQLNLKHYPEIDSHKDTKYNIEEHNTDFDVDYDFDNGFLSHTDRNTQTKNVVRAVKVNKEDTYKHQSKTKHQQRGPSSVIDIDFNNSKRRDNIRLYDKDRNYEKDFETDRNEFGDDFEKYDIENNEELKRVNNEKDIIINDYKNKHTFNKDHFDNRHREKNHVVSAEKADKERSRRLHKLYENTLSRRGTYKPANSRSRFQNVDRKEHKKRDSYKNMYYEYDDDPLGTERRKYYQEKLDKLHRRVQDRQHYAHTKKRGNRSMRPMRPTEDFNTRSKIMDTPYIPDGARFLHGF